MTEDNTSSPFDDVVDDLMPYDLDWRHLVRSYPIPALTAAAIGGFVIGRRHGWPLVTALAEHATREVQRNVDSMLDGVMAGGRDDSDD